MAMYLHFQLMVWSIFSVF